MKIIVKFSPEIIIKSRSVRIFFVKVLISNIKIVLKKHGKSLLIMRRWDCLEIECNDDKEIFLLLKNIPGIHHFLIVKKNKFSSLQDISEKVMLFINFMKLENKSFCVRVKRRGNHCFTSSQAECYLGDVILKKIHNTCVNLTRPENTICLEIKDNYFFIVIKRYVGLGGLPIGTQKELLSLVSGGFDSIISSYMLIKRGCKVHYCFFNFSGIVYVEEVCKVINYLWNRFSKSHKVKFISIDFSGVVKEIISKIQSNYAGLVLKRMMVRAASAIASYYKINALLTGEVLGQVSSQTLDNLALIDCISDLMILRPLIAYDKEDIIALARQIGTEEFSRIVPEYCAVVSKKSTGKSTKKRVEFEESRFNFMILDHAIVHAHVLDIQNIFQQISNQNFFRISTQTILCCDDIVLDIRPENEQQKNPLYIDNIEIKKIPFYKLVNKFSQLDQNKIYLLYCSHGVMSKLQAIHLYKQGFFNVKIYRPAYVI